MSLLLFPVLPPGSLTAEQEHVAVSSLLSARACPCHSGLSGLCCVSPSVSYGRDLISWTSCQMLLEGSLETVAVSLAAPVMLA